MPPSFLLFFIDSSPIAVSAIYVAQMLLVLGIHPLSRVDQVLLILSMPLVFAFSLALAFVIEKARLHSMKKEAVLFDRVGYEWTQMGTVVGFGWIALSLILPQEVPIHQYILMVVPVLGWFAWSIVFMLLFPLLYILTDEGIWIRSWGAFYLVPFSEIVTVQYLSESRAMLPSPSTRPITRWHGFVFIEYGIGRKMARRIFRKYLTPSDPALFMKTLSAHMAQRQKKA